MAGMTRYSVDSDVRSRATLCVASISVVLVVLFDVCIVPRLPGWMNAIGLGEAYSALASIGVIGAIGPMALFGLLWVAFDKVLWAWWPFRALHKIPDLNGIWSGDGLSSFADGQSGSKRYKVNLEVTQTFSMIQCTMHFKHSDSESATVGINGCNFEKRSCNLEFSYSNTAGEKSIEVEDWQMNHNGFNVIRCEGDMMKGHYFTDRDPQTKGTFELNRQVADSHFLARVEKALKGRMACPR